MIFSTQALTTVLFGGSLLAAGSCVHGSDTGDRNQEYATLVRDQLERSLEGAFDDAAAGTKEEEEPRFLRSQRRDLGGDMEMSDLHTDYSIFEGDWYDCLHTKLMTFNGNPADKHTVSLKECDGGLFGSVTRVQDTTKGLNAQTLQMEVIILNHCFMHGLGSPF